MDPQTLSDAQIEQMALAHYRHGRLGLITEFDWSQERWHQMEAMRAAVRSLSELPQDGSSK